MMKLSAAFLLPLVSAAAFKQHLQSPILSVDKAIDAAAPGIGVHFTTSYATAVVRYSNGTFQNLVQVCVKAGDDVFGVLM